MSVKFEVKMTTKIMNDFMLYHNYTQLSGIVGAMLGVVGLWIGIKNISGGNSQTAIAGFAIAFLFLLWTPMNTKRMAKRQVENTPMFQKPLEYELHEEGVTIRQEDAQALNKWEDIAKAVSTNNSIILYITRVRAIIFPKSSMGDKYEDVIKMISTHMPPAKVKIRHIH